MLLYSTHGSPSNDYFVLRSYHVNTNQSMQIVRAKIWNDLPRELKDKVGYTSHRLMSKQLKEPFFTANVGNKAFQFYQIFTLISFLFASFTEIELLLALLLFTLFIYTLYH